MIPALTVSRRVIPASGTSECSRYADAIGKDLVVLPLPDFGAGTKSGQGSWAWGIGGPSQNGKAAGALAQTCGSNPPNPDCVATPRPVTPAYPVISLEFSSDCSRPAPAWCDGGVSLPGRILDELG